MIIYHHPLEIENDRLRREIIDLVEQLMALHYELAKRPARRFESGHTAEVLVFGRRDDA